MARVLYIKCTCWSINIKRVAISSFTQVWCTFYTEQYALLDLVNNEHSNGKYRFVVLSDDSLPTKSINAMVTKRRTIFQRWSEFHACNFYSIVELIKCRLFFSRVNGVLMNVPEFSDAFGCPSTAAMNPAKKCSVW